jgi:transcriptional regulator with XRE-family HTH domain
MQRKSISSREIAARVGVSVMTVSRALNNKPGVSEKIKQHILASCEELGYQINPSIQDLVLKSRSGFTRNIAFVMVGAEFADPAYARAMDGIAKAINEFGYNLGLAHLTGKEHSAQHLPPGLFRQRIHHAHYDRHRPYSGKMGRGRLGTARAATAQSGNRVRCSGRRLHPERHGPALHNILRRQPRQAGSAMFNFKN